MLSATIGNCDQVVDWLQPCDIVQSNLRRPPLHQQVVVVEDGECADEIIISRLDNILVEESTSVVVFVYRTTDVNRLAQKIAEFFKPKLGSNIAAAYHSKFPVAQKRIIKSDYEKGKILCLVSTTALGAGVNLPATHVFLRDLTFARDGAPPIQDILQMMGRAGRGKISGNATIILNRPTDGKRTLWSRRSSHPIYPNLNLF